VPGSSLKGKCESNRHQVLWSWAWNETGATEKAEAIAAAARNKTARIIVCKCTWKIHTYKKTHALDLKRDYQNHTTNWSGEGFNNLSTKTFHNK
jgi:hypothetical protein